MVRKLLFSVALAALTSPAFASYVVTTGSDVVLTPGTAGNPPAVGDIFATPTNTTTPPGVAGTFTNYVATSPSDPQLTGGDLPNYRYTLNGSVSAVNLTLGEITYTGTYDIFYDANLNGQLDGGEPSVSSGNFSILATFLPGTNNASLAGTLTQTAGPTNPAFADLSEGGNPVVYAGFYTGDNPDVSGHIQGTLTQTGSVPEPASLSLLALGAAALLRRRK